MEYTNLYINKLEFLISNIISKLDEFSHIDLNRIILSLKSSPKKEINSYYAEIKCLNNSANIKEVNGRLTKHYYCQSLLKNGIPANYIIFFTIPDFINLDYKEKLITIMHELYHISPSFNGELRLFNNKKCLHGKYPDKYDEYMNYLAEIFLKQEKNIDEIFYLNEETLKSKNLILKTNSIRQNKKSIYKLIWA